MKRLLYFIVLLPFIFVSCKNDDEIPNVDFKVEISGGKYVNDKIYVVKGDTLTLEKVEIVSHDKNATIGEVSYFWDGQFIFTNPFPPYKISISTNKMALDVHRLHFNCPVYAEDYPILTAYFDYKVELVEIQDSIPNQPSQPIINGYSIVRD